MCQSLKLHLVKAFWRDGQGDEKDGREYLHREVVQLGTEEFHQHGDYG